MAKYVADKSKRAAKSVKRSFDDVKTDMPVQTKAAPPNTAKEVKNDKIPITQEKFNEVINLEQGNRPAEVTEYLPKDYVDAHLDKFNKEGGAFIVIDAWIKNPDYASFPKDGTFVGLRTEMDMTISKYKAGGNDPKVLVSELNLGDNVNLDNTKISYMTLEPNDSRFSY